MQVWRATNTIAKVGTAKFYISVKFKFIDMTSAIADFGHFLSFGWHYIKCNMCDAFKATASKICCSLFESTIAVGIVNFFRLK